MKFYLNNVEVKVLVAPEITETFDETLDTASVTLEHNSVSTPYAPMQEFKIDFENQTDGYVIFYVVSDQVSIFSVNPTLYTHQLTLIQNTRKLSKHLVRDSAFSQPYTDRKIGYVATTYVKDWTNDEIVFRKLHPITQYAEWIEPIQVSRKEKFRTGKLKFKLSTFIFTPSSVTQSTSTSDIFSSVQTSFNISIVRNNQQISTFAINSDNYTEWNEFDISQYAGQDGNIYFVFSSNPIGKTDSAIGNMVRVVFHIDFYLETYYYNAYDLIGLLLDRYRNVEETNTATPRLFNLPNSGDLYDLLKNTIPPNFTFTGMSMYECIADIFKLYDAIFTLSNDNTLGIEYFNEYNGQVSNSMNFSSSSSAIGEDRYINKLVNYYQDARVTEIYPNKLDYAGLRTTELGVPSQNAYNLLLPHNISQLIKITMKMPQIKFGYIYNNGCTNATINFPFELDITPFVLEQGLWSLLNSTEIYPLNSDYQNIIQICSTYYSNNGNNIAFASWYKDSTSVTQNTIVNLMQSAVKRWLGYRAIDTWTPVLRYDYDMPEIDFSVGSTKWQNLLFRVEYLTTISGKVQNESLRNKYDGEMVIGQQSGAIDLNKLGLNMQGLSLKLGEPTLTMTHQIATWNNRIKKGQYIVKDNEKWVANICKYTLFNDKMVGVIEFSKNYNALSQYVKLNQEKRLSTIDKSLVMKSETMLLDYVYVSSVENNDYLRPATEKLMFNYLSLYRGFCRTFTYDASWESSPEYATIDTFYSNNNVYTYTDKNGTTHSCYDIYIPLIKYACGNTLCFECSFDDPKSAGNKFSVEGSGAWANPYHFFSSYIPYTDNNGFCDKITVRMKYGNATKDLSTLPELYGSGVRNDTDMITLPKLEYWKQPNEILAFNYQVAILPLESRKDIDFVGSKMISNNALISNERDFMPEKFVFYYSRSDVYSILDTKGIGTAINVVSVSTNRLSLETYFRVRFIHNGSLTDLSNIKSWAICDSKGNIYFATNNAPTSASQVDIHFYPHHKKVSIN